MSGKRIYKSGRTGEEPPRTWAMRSNDGVWEWEKRRHLPIYYAITLFCASLVIGGLALWRMF